MQAAFREAREKELLDNHKGGLSDFLDGIGGECYRAGGLSLLEFQICQVKGEEGNRVIE